ncbi:hypothetical protein DICPUDRAFT_26757 [Dictyostelium purpureum]|uniref:PBZ-type domain-containing protein n=1 Tax=Dictyostelium purpureum TaxID=5786 RepID=F0Z946_DICPU|nr:uncharacterized protein DICPUDRAFT_26757 [Dictyostelium purpureum]EGC39492.1 hypothetical protein DICPUDRAFT_26757 [Dictyostelium purpureum]|eukprot:XP_003283939.1 hypothetical protein DICPUDRAFT_26757 [Dictyostelium purpureum]
MTKLKYNIRVKCIDGSLGKDEYIVYDKAGTFSIGRGSFEKLQEKKCSRKQVSIIINDDNSYYISSNGVNPSYLKKHDEEYFVQMNKDQNYVLNDKDCFSLLFEMFTFMVVFESNEKINSNNNSNIGNSSNKGSNSNDSSSVGSANDSSSNKNNKRKLEQEQTDDKPKKMCPYGANCFRKNPAHFEEFDHNDIDKKQQQKQHKDDGDNESLQKQQQQQKQNENDEQSKQSENKKINNTNVNGNSISNNNKPSQQLKQEQEQENNSNIGKIIGPKYKKKKLTDALKERSLAFPFISTTTFEYDIEKATEIAAKAISEYLSFHEQDGDDIKLKMMVEKSVYSDQLIENFKKLFNNKWDKRFEIVKINNSNSLEQFNCNCKLFASETNWRLKKTPQNKVLYDEMLDGQFEKETKNRFPNPGKIGKVYPIPISNSNCILKKEYGVETVVLVLGPNMSEKKPDQFKDYKEASPILLESYHSLFSVLDNF